MPESFVRRLAFGGYVLASQMSISQAYILQTGRVIAPFDRPVGTMPVHNLTLRQWQQRVLERLGLKVDCIEHAEQIHRLPCVVVADDLYFTHQSAAWFVKQLRRRLAGEHRAHTGRPRLAAAAGWRAALARSELTERLLSGLQGDEMQAPDGRDCRAYDCYGLLQVEPGRALAEQTELLCLSAPQTRIRVRAARAFEPSGKFSIPVSPVFLTPIRHWAALVAANLLGMPGLLLDQLRCRPLSAALLPLRALWRAGSLRPGRLAGKLYLAQHGCQVHPTAHVEGAVLGPRVRIGPHAVVRACVIGPRSEIGPGAVVEGCTLGSEVTVNGNVVLRCSVVGDRASVGCFFNQFSVIGADSVLCPASGMLDFHLSGEVAVRFEGRSISSGSRLLGGCLGDGVFLGPAVRLLAGQEVPPGTILVPSPRNLVRRPEDSLPPGVVRVDRRVAGDSQQRQDSDRGQRRAG